MIAELRSATVAALLAPLLSGCGMLIFPDWVLAEMARICATHGVLLIADEVMRAWGRTGTLLACEQAEVVPDILCLSKGLTGGSVPLAVTVASEAIWDAHYSTDRARTFFHSWSYTANPIACAAAAANLAIWREEPVLERAARLADEKSRRLKKLASVPGVHNPRALGTITACEIGGGGGAYLSTLGPDCSGSSATGASSSGR